MKTLTAIASLAAALFNCAAFATDANEFRNLGFSADARYFAFAETVVLDGSGFPKASVAVIDVAQNKMLKRQSVILQDERATVAQALQKALAQVNPGAYGIDGKNKGRTLWVHMPTDLSAPVQSALFSTNYAVDGGASSVWPKYQLLVTEQNAHSGIDCDGYGDNMITVNLENVGDATTLLLQKDVAAPKSRRCSQAYQIRQVIENQGSIVAVLRFEMMGFEGPDYNHMVVTARGALR